jgi:hypothetical protein
MKLALAFVLGFLTASLAADDPVITLPGAYKLQFENDWVKVVKVTYAPYAKLPAHAHTKMGAAAAYVYLNDSGPVVFRHLGKDYGPVTRPATKAQAFRLYKAVGEDHEVESLSPVASQFLRVEFRTEAREPDTLRGRFYSEPAVNRTARAAGQEHWISVNQSEELQNTGSSELELLRFDFKTPPAASR